MRFYSLGQLSNTDKNNILNKHKELYNGYKQVAQPISNEQPLYVQDFAGDKNGITVNNKGEVSGYNNKIYMRESEEKMCSECGGMMYEGECSECGYGKMEEETEEGIYDVEDINPKNKFDYTDESEMDEDHMELYEPMESAFADELDEISGPSPLYSDVKPAFNFKSEGPNYADGPYGGMREDEFDEIDLDKLEKGKKYKFKSPSFEDDLEYEDEHHYPTGEKHYAFKGDKGHGHLMSGNRIEDFMSDIEDEPYSDIEDEGEMDTPFSKMRRGHEPEDVEWEDIDDDIKESFITQKNKINEMFNRFKKYN
jgi:hypothetical protein